MSHIVKKQLVIQLKSDLISGSGEGWGNIVDTDVTHDEYGFPYIPSRRLRGLLKEAALELEDFEIVSKGTSENLFGNEENQGHHFVIYNASLKHIDDMRNEIKHLKNEYRKYVQSISVLNHYTTVRYQTAIDDDGIAKDTSLRSSRAIHKGNTFYAYVECEEQDVDILEKCCAMIHHMGLNRTRGFGEVDLFFQDFDIKSKEFSLDLDDDKEYEVRLYLENKTQLSIVNQGEKSLDYITGSSLLGYFANQYLKTHEVDKRFYELFVLGHVKFLNAYISDENWNEYIPVRESFFKEKVGTEYYDKTIDVDNGQILSKVRNKYMSHHYLKEVQKEMFYHHRRPKDKSIGHVISNDSLEEGTFYQLEVLSANQKFIGKVSGLGKDLKDALGTIGAYIQIGRSKYTQYGNVYVDHIQCQERKENIISKGTEVVCTLASPLLVLDEKREGQLHTHVLSDLLHLEHPEYFIGYSQVGGYNAKWKLQKPSYTAFSAGSCVKGILTEDMNSHVVLGNLTQEGLGQVIIQDKKDIHSHIRDIENLAYNLEPRFTKEIVMTSGKHQLHLDFLQSIDYISSKHMTNTLINRVLRMLEKPTWEDFIKDVEGIADKEKNKIVNDTITKIQSKCNELYNHSVVKKFEDQTYQKEFYRQSCKDYFTKKKIEGRDA